MLNRLGVALSSIALVGLVFAPCLAFAADAVVASEKVETVNVTADATGAVEKVDVDVTLKNAGSSAELRDVSTLADIKGKDGATCSASGDELVWKADGKDVSYSGTTSAALPVSMSVTYRLDGRVVSPEEIAGKSGDVSIRYDFTNESELEGHPDMCMPFTCITALMFSGDDFTDVKVTNGKVIDDGSDSIVMGYAMPGLKQSLGSLVENSDIPDHFEVTAKTKRFELKSTMTIVTAGLMTDLDVDGLGFGDLDGTSAGLSEGMAQLKSGASELSDGAKALSGGADDMATGADQFSFGLGQLTYGPKGNSGLVKASSSAKRLAEGLKSAEKDISGASDGLKSLVKSLNSIIASYPTDSSGLLAKIAADPNYTDEEKKAVATAFGIKERLETLSGSVSDSAKKMADESSKFSEIVSEAEGLSDGMGVAAEKAVQLYSESLMLSEGAGMLSSGVTQLAEGTDSLEEGLVEFDEQGVSKIVSMIDNDLGGLKKRLSALSDAATAYDNFSGKEAGTPSSVKFVFETAAIESD